MNSLSFRPSIDIITGPMYCGKTTALIRKLIIYHELDMKVLYINSNKDNRSEDSFSTHNCTIGQIPFENKKVSSLVECDVSKYDVIGIDEAQLFSNLKSTVLEWAEKLNKIVIVAGLNGDFQRNAFGELIELLPFCDNITKLSPFCTECKNRRNDIRPAIFTKRKNSDKNVILIGGKNIYTPVCRKCFLE